MLKIMSLNVKLKITSYGIVYTRPAFSRNEHDISIRNKHLLSFFFLFSSYTVRFDNPLIIGFTRWHETDLHEF